MQDKSNGPNQSVLRQAAVVRAQAHQTLVDANSQCLAEAASELVGLDADPRAFEIWLEGLRVSREGKTS